MRTVSNDQLSQVTKQISETLDKLEGSNCFQLPRSLSMERLSQKKLDMSESVAAVMNCSKSIDEASKHIRHVTNPKSIFTPDPFSKITVSSSQTRDGNDNKFVGSDKNIQVDSHVDECIQAELDSKSRKDEAQTVNLQHPSIIAEMQEKIDNLQKEIMIISNQKIVVSSPITKESIDPETLGILKSKLRKAELEIKSLSEQNLIISAENQKFIVNVTSKTENVSKEREIIYSIIHDFVVDNSINQHFPAKSLLDQISKSLYSLVEHSNDVFQLNRMKDMFLYFREAIIQIVNESIHLDQKISSLADSSNKIRLESSEIISQLEEKTRVLIKENQDLLETIQDLQSEQKSKPAGIIDDKNVSSRSFLNILEPDNEKVDNLDFKNPEYQEQRLHDQEQRLHDEERHMKHLNQHKKDQERYIKDQEKIKNLTSEVERLNCQLSTFKEKIPDYPLSDLYEKIVALINRDASSGLNIKEILEWVDEKRIVMEELEKLRSNHSNLLFKHKHLLKEYSDQKSTMDEIEKKITIKESEWQTKFQEFTTNAHKLEDRHKILESIICDYSIQFQGVLSLSSDTTSNFDHPHPFLKYFGNLQKSNSSLDHSLQHATSALGESQRVASHALQNIQVKSSQIMTLEKEKQEIQTLITKFKSEISSKDKEISLMKTQKVKLEDHNLKLSERLKRIADAFKWTMI